MREHTKRGGFLCEEGAWQISCACSFLSSYLYTKIRGGYHVPGIPQPNRAPWLSVSVSDSGPSIRPECIHGWDGPEDPAGSIHPLPLYLALRDTSCPRPSAAHPHLPARRSGHRLRSPPIPLTNSTAPSTVRRQRVAAAMTAPQQSLYATLGMPGWCQVRCESPREHAVRGRAKALWYRRTQRLRPARS